MDPVEASTTYPVYIVSADYLVVVFRKRNKEQSIRVACCVARRTDQHGLLAKQKGRTMATAYHCRRRSLSSREE